MPSIDAGSRKRHWAKTRNLAFAVVAVWGLAAILVPLAATAVGVFPFLDTPLGPIAWAQGSLFAAIVLIWLLNLRQDRIDDATGAGD